MEVSEEEMGFIRAAIANPDDDAVRLIYSDWLEEHERNPHFIRLQTDQRYSFASTEHWCPNPRRALSAHEVSYPQESTIWIDITGDMVGFCEYIRCPAVWWLKHADEVTKYHPIREVHLTTWPEVETVYEFGIACGYKLSATSKCKGLFFSHLIPYVMGVCSFMSQEAELSATKLLMNRIWPNIKFVMPNNQPQEVA